MLCIAGSRLVILGAAFLLTAGWNSGADEKNPRHLTDARNLVRDLKLESTEYDHGRAEIVWEGSVRAKCDCSSLVGALLRRSYGYTEADLRKWFGVQKRPLAKHYHSAIADGKGRGFIRITHLKDIRPGDILAIKYAKPAKDKSTGHVMVVDGPPRETAPLPRKVKDAFKQWQVLVLDSSRKAHGETDTRYEKGVTRTGVGKGPVLIYTDAEDKVVAYAWSPKTTTIYYSKDRHMVIGRLVPDFKP